MLETAGTRVATLRLRSSAHDAAGLRLAVERQLSGVELPTPGLPPSALVVIRRLEDPRPGSFDGASSGFRPPAEWERALRESVADLGRSAAWPERGESASAAAVAFSDRAALVACLATDLVRGSADSRWWWKRAELLLPELVRLPDSPSEIARLFVALAPETPAALTRLVELRAAAEVLGHLSDDQAEEVLRSLVHAFELPADLVDRPATAATSDVATKDRSSPPPPLRPTAPDVEAARRERAPWVAWVPRREAAVGLSDRQHWLLGLGLGLQRAPGVVRSRPFVRRVRRWWEARCLLLRHRELLLRTPGRHSVRGPQVGHEPILRELAPGLEAGGRFEDLPIAHPGRPDATALPSMVASGEDGAISGPARGAVGSAALPTGIDGPPIEEENARSAAELETAPKGVAPPTPCGVEVPPKGNAASRVERELPPGGVAAAPEAELEAMVESGTPEGGGETSICDSLAGAVFETALGGVLYLVTALRELEIPAAFAADWWIPSRLGPWGALDLVARTLIGSSFPKHSHDPLWAALAELRGEVEDCSSEPVEGGRISHRCLLWAWEGLPAYRAPHPWSARLEGCDPAFRWAANRRRLWLWSEAGYPVAAVPRRGRHPSRQAAEELAAYQGRSGATLRRARLADVPLAAKNTFEDHEAALLVCWAAAVAPAVRQRLLLALGRSTRARDPVLRLLNLKAQLYLTSSHVDLVADLDRVWMPARLAGLDRDPGWLPDYGRVVLFHFE